MKITRKQLRMLISEEASYSEDDEIRLKAAQGMEDILDQAPEFADKPSPGDVSDIDWEAGAFTLTNTFNGTQIEMVFDPDDPPEWLRDGPLTFQDLVDVMKDVTVQPNPDQPPVQLDTKTAKAARDMSKGLASAIEKEEQSSSKTYSGPKGKGKERYIVTAQMVKYHGAGDADFDSSVFYILDTHDGTEFKITGKDLPYSLPSSQGEIEIHDITPRKSAFQSDLIASLNNKEFRLQLKSLNEKRIRSKIREIILNESEDPDVWFGTGFKLGTSVNLSKDINTEGVLVGEKGLYKLVWWSKGSDTIRDIVKNKQDIKAFKLAKGFTQDSLERIINNPKKGVLSIETRSSIVPQGSTGKTAHGVRGESTVGELSNIKDLALEITGIQFAWDLGAAIGKFETALAAMTRPNLHPSERERYGKELDEAFVQLALFIIVTAVSAGLFVIGASAVRSLASKFPRLAKSLPTKKSTAKPAKAEKIDSWSEVLPPAEEIKAAKSALESYRDVRISKLSTRPAESSNTKLAKDLADEAIKAADELYGTGKGVIALPVKKPARRPKIKRSETLRNLPESAKVAEKEVGGKILSKAGEGVDGDVYIMRLDDPISMHKDVALKVLKPSGMTSLNVRAARWISNKRASLDPDTAKYLPEILKAGKLSSGEQFIVIEQLAPLPPRVLRLFDSFEKDIAKQVMKDPDMFMGYIDTFVAKVQVELPYILGIMGPRWETNLKNSIIKYINNPKSISPEAKALFNKVDFDGAGLGEGQIEGLNKVIPGLLEYLVKLRKTTKFTMQQRQKAGRPPGSVPDDLKPLDTHIENMSNIGFWNSNTWLGRFTHYADWGRGRSIPRYLGDTSTADVIGGMAAESDPVVKNTINAMIKLDDAGFTPQDLHAGNWLIRPSTGDLVMADFGRFDVKTMVRENKIRDIIRGIIAEKSYAGYHPEESYEEGTIEKLMLDKDTSHGGWPEGPSKSFTSKKSVNAQIASWLKDMKMVKR